MHLKMRRELTAAVLAMAMMFACGVPAFAFSKNDILQQNGDGLYVATTPVPAGAATYARRTIAGMLCKEYDLTRITLGTPFSVQGEDCDLYYFAVMYDGTIIGAYRVFQLDEGRYAGIYAEDLNMATALSVLADTSSYLSPARIVVGQYEDLYAVTANSVHTVLPDYAGRVTSVNAVCVSANTMTAAAETVSVVDISENIGFADNTSNVLSATAYGNNYLSWYDVITETQSGNSWCGAYATAAICRYVFNTDDYTAREIMEWAYPTVSDANLTNRSLSMSGSVTYGQRQGLSPQIVNASPSFSAVAAEIDSDCPVYFYGERSGGAHAFVCRGYDMNEDMNDPFYSVWNPWYSYCELVYASTNRYVTNAGVIYEMTAYIRNWE